MVEFETDVTIEEDFDDWNNDDKIDLIKAIINGKCWSFNGIDTVNYEPDDRY